MSKETRFHVELQTEINLAAGMAPGEARSLARRQVGHVVVIKEDCCDHRVALRTE